MDIFIILDSWCFQSWFLCRCSRVRCFGLSLHEIQGKITSTENFFSVPVLFSKLVITDNEVGNWNNWKFYNLQDYFFKGQTGNFIIFKIIFLKAKRVEMLLDEVRDAESVVFTYRKDLKEMGMRLKQQHNLYQVCMPFVRVLSVVNLDWVLNF